MSVIPVLSALTVSTVGLLCKGFLNLGFCSSVRVNGLQNLLDALEDEGRKEGRGVVTVANHISVLDDPLMWGVLPTSSYLSSRRTRWALGASDIMFTNPTFSMFFRYGQVLETFRGKGIYQEAVDLAIQKLNDGAWVHLFGEGKVNQPDTYPVDKTGVARLPRFKWGTGRVSMETQHIPIIIPMWISGFENVMPESRGFPRFLPRIDQHVVVTFAPPMDTTKLREILDPWHAKANASYGRGQVPLGDETDEKRSVRSALTEVIRQEVEKVGHIVSGPLLGKIPDSNSRLNE